MVVADASVLIALAKIGRLWLLKDVRGEVIVGPEVKREVVDEGRAAGAPEVAHVERALEEGWLQAARLTTRERRLAEKLQGTTGLDKGEMESPALAQPRKTMLLADDKEARAVAGAMGVEYMGTAGLLLEALIRGRISLEELEDAVGELGRVTWLSPDVVADILRRAKEVRR